MVKIIILKKSNLKKSSLPLPICLFFILFLLLLIGNLFNVSAFLYIDDFIGLIGVLLSPYLISKKKYRFSLFSLILLFIFGIIGNSLSGYPRSMLLILEDYFFVFKFAFIFILFDCFLGKSKKHLPSLLFLITVTFSILILIMFPVCLYQVMSGQEKANFFCGYSGCVGLYCFLFLIVFTFSKGFFALNKKSNFFLSFLQLISVLTCILSKSSTSFVFILLFLSFLLFLNFPKKKLLLVSAFALVLLISFFLFKSKILGYLFSNSAPRNNLFIESFHLLAEHFPFGIGFSLFGGKIAANNYSPLYYDLGWNNTYTLGINSSFLLDTYFPTIIGEIGFLGVISFFLLTYSFFKIITSSVKGKNTYYKLMGAFLLVCILISGFFFNFINSGVGVSFIILAIVFSKISKSISLKV